MPLESIELQIISEHKIIKTLMNFKKVQEVSFWHLEKVYFIYIDCIILVICIDLIILVILIAR